MNELKRLILLLMKNLLRFVYLEKMMPTLDCKRNVVEKALILLFYIFG
jgi:hypothetical protein